MKTNGKNNAGTNGRSNGKAAMGEVVIVGGGPAGAAMGCYLSMAGIPNIIIERANHPRPHVGESLVPITTAYLDEIGVLDRMEEVGFVRKFGAAWHPPSGSDVVWVQFKAIPKRGVNQDHSYHVDRAKFDLMLLKRAEELGSRVYQGVHVHEMIFEDGAAKGVRCRIAGQDVEIRSPLVIDATGRGTLVGKQLGLKKNDPLFDQFTAYAWYKNVNRTQYNPDFADYIHIYFLNRTARGWAWQIPITDDITSIGIVARKEEFRKAKGDVGAWFDEHVKNHPTLAKAMEGAERASQFDTEGDYSYSLDRFVGNGFMLIGDAARFVDPIFSSGVSVALASAQIASRSIRKSFETGDFSAEALAPYETKLRQGVEIWYDFIRLYYKLLPVFTYFVQKGEYAGLEQLLSGDVYNRDEAPPVLEKMRQFVRAVETAESHPLKGALSDMPID